MGDTLRRGGLPGDRGWAAGAEDFALGPQAVHVWRAGLDVEAAQVETLREILDENERSRAQGFLFERDRRRFIVSHGVLRVMLGRYLGIEPKEIGFAQNAWGKPSVAAAAGGSARPTGALDLRFNMSHSHELALYALAAGREVGVDIEYVESARACAEIAERFFASDEAAAIKALPEESRPRAFFACWTRKEAYVKATGMGLSIPLDGFVVSIAPGLVLRSEAPLRRVADDSALLSTTFDEREAGRWSLIDIAAGPLYAAAIAVQGHGFDLELRDYSRTRRQ